MTPDQLEVMGLDLSGSPDPYQNRRPGSPPETVFDHLLEVAPLGSLAVYMGDHVSNPDAGNLGRTACHQLFHDDSAVSPRSSVDADAAEVFRRDRCKAC